MKDKEQLIKVLDSVFKEYTENLWRVPDPNLIKEEFDEIWGWSTDLKSDLLDPDDVLCVSDMERETIHKHLVNPVMDEFEFKF